MPFAASLSQHPDARVAVAEAAGDVVDHIGGDVDLAWIFATAAHAAVLPDVAEVVHRTLAPRTLVGATAAAVVGGARGVEVQPGLSVFAARLPARRAPCAFGSAGTPATRPAGAHSTDRARCPRHRRRARRASSARNGSPGASAADASRGVLGADRRTGAVAVGDVVPVGATVQFQVRDARTAGEDLVTLLRGHTTSARALGQGEPAAALVFTCNGGGSFTFRDAHHDAAIVDETLGGVPAAGMFCAGELGAIGARNALHGFTDSVAVFREPTCPGRTVDVTHERSA